MRHITCVQQKWMVWPRWMGGRAKPSVKVVGRRLRPRGAKRMTYLANRRLAEAEMRAGTDRQTRVI